MRRAARFLLLLCAAFMISGCVTSKPTSFSHTTAPGWATVEIRDGVDFDHAWDTIFGILSHDFDFSTVLKEDGYIQTDWLYTWSGVYQQNYRVRVTVQFSTNRKSIRVKSEAWALNGSVWVIGTDSRLMTTLKTDLMGTVGRTAR